MNRYTSILLCTAMLLVAGAAPASAQDARSSWIVIGGVSQYDLSGTGTTAFGGLRLLQPLGRVLAVEPGVTLLSYSSQGGDRTRHVLPELQLQAQVPGRVFRPYLGAGAGLSWALRPDPLENSIQATLSAAGGVRIVFAEDWRLTAELRVRAIDPWVATTADWGVGVGRAL